MSAREIWSRLPYAVGLHYVMEFWAMPPFVDEEVPCRFIVTRSGQSNFRKLAG